MGNRNSLTGALALLGAFALCGAVQAQTPAGQADLSGGSRFTVKHCGRTGGPVSFDFAIAADGAWVLDTGANVYTGSATGNRRVARLVPDAASLATIESVLEAEAGALCGVPVDLGPVHAIGAIVVNKRQTRARILVRVGAVADVDSRPARAIYRARARGPWVPALAP